MHNRKQQTVLFEDTFAKPVHVAFDAESLSSDGGAMLLAQLDQGIGLTRSLLSQMTDSRQPGKIEFTFGELIRQRTYAIALGYEDGIDANSLAGDPMMKLAVGRDPEADPDLASQSTISRFENAPSTRQIVEMGRGLEKFVIGRLARRNRNAKVITLDFDSTVDPVHGKQQLSLFNGFYDTHCYLPLLGFISIDDEPEQHLFHARLRPGTVRCYRGVIPALRRTVAEVRRRFPNARVMIRMDAGFCHPLVIDVLEELKLVYAIGMGKNAVLKKLARDWMTMSRTLAGRTGETHTLFGAADYKAGSWSRERRVVIKAEVLCYPGRDLKDNERFVITNRPKMSPENLYRWYCGRGDSENRIKELKHDLSIDRTSCCKFVANQFRVLMTSAAFVLFQEMRWRLRNTRAARSSVGKLRDMLLKVAVRVVSSCRRIVCHFPTHMPWADVWYKAARMSGAALA
jgi:hypothetical protein